MELSFLLSLIFRNWVLFLVVCSNHSTSDSFGGFIKGVKQSVRYDSSFTPNKSLLESQHLCLDGKKGENSFANLLLKRVGFKIYNYLDVEPKNPIGEFNGVCLFVFFFFGGRKVVSSK